LNIGTLVNNNIVNLAGGTLSGLIQDTGDIHGNGTIAGSITDSGQVLATGGTLEIANAIAGTSIAFEIGNGSGNVLRIDGAAASGTGLAFLGTGTLQIENLANFAGTISGMTVGTSQTVPTTAIDINQSILSGTVVGTNLNLFTASGETTLALGNSEPVSTGVSLISDGNGGTDVFFTTTACYLAGTRILTPQGETEVEALSAGDMVIVETADGRSSQPIKWIGQRRIQLTSHPRPGSAAPIRIARDAIADGQPHRDLLVSPDHCVFVDGKLIPAVMLVNDMTIVQEQSRISVQYFHVELERHGILLAEGLPAESYLDTGNRAMFANAGLALLLHPEFQVNESLRTWRDDACAPLAVDPATLQPIWQRFAERAQQLGFQPMELTTTADPDLRVVVGGATIAPIESTADRYVFILPPGTDRVVLSSRATRPADIVRYLDDRRRLGIAVGGITLRAGEDITVFPADNIPAGAGWHAWERDPESLWRWTDGAGELRLDPLSQATVLEV
ncbi:MAG TPA: Hint domain-containing protein, partial [Rhodopila sp.]